MRGLVSQQLDGQTSQFEAALARAHLRDCAGCATFEAEVGAFTALLRAAELERMPREITLPRALRYRRSFVARGAVATAAVAMAAVASGGSARLAESTGSSRATQAPANDAVRIAAPAVAPTLTPLRELIRDDLSHGRVPLLPVLEDEGLGAMKPVLPAANI